MIDVLEQGRKMVPLHNLVLLWIFYQQILQTSGRLKITQPVSRRLGESIVLQCIYSGPDDWLLMQWKKRGTSTADKNYITMVSTSPSAMNVAIHNVNRNSVRADVSNATGEIVFNLHISEIWCSDAGKYKCDITTIKGFLSGETRLMVEYPPERPQIHYDTLVIEPNNSFTLPCKSNVGNPPGKLEWYSRHQHSDTYRLVDNHDIISEQTEETCSSIVISFINISMSTDLDGSVFRCMLKEDTPANSQHVDYYDEVILKTPVLPAYAVDDDRGNYRYRSIHDEGKEFTPSSGADITIFSSALLIPVCSYVMWI